MIDFTRKHFAVILVIYGSVKYPSHKNITRDVHCISLVCLKRRQGAYDYENKDQDDVGGLPLRD